MKVLLCIVSFCGVICWGGLLYANPEEGETPGKSAPDDDSLRSLDEPGMPYRPLLSGEGFRTKVLGREVRVEPRDRRVVNAWDLGIANSPRADSSEVLPFGALYFWRHPDEDTLFRGVVVGLFNEIYYAKSPKNWGSFEWIATLETFTVPVGQLEVIDGEDLESEDLIWGYVRPGLGFGYRRQIAPGKQDNMLALGFTVEPGLLFFDEGKDAATNFDAPQTTFESRFRLQFRMDALERNLIELPHCGFAVGADLVYGHRAPWDGWGRPGASTYHTPGSSRDYVGFTGYSLGVTGVPFVKSERHRLLAKVHGGVGEGVDRFSAVRVGGGPDPRGEEYGSVWRPFLPGAAINEFFPEHYVVALAAYRFEPTFFSSISLGGFIGYLERVRSSATRTLRKEEDVFPGVVTRLTTGFVLETRLQIEYAYNWGVIRKEEYGGHGVVVHVSGQF